MSAPTFIENAERANATVSQHCEGVKEQCLAGNTGLDAQVAFMDDYPQKTSELLDREAPKAVNNIPEVGTSSALVTKQEPQR